MNKLLRDNNIKSTPTRVKILELFQDNEELTIHDIKIKELGMDQSTIYRTIELFVKKNILIKSITDGNVVYSLKSNHNHYLNCIKCHKKIRIDTCPLKDDIEGFKIINHTLSIEGICPKCQNK